MEGDALNGFYDANEAKAKYDQMKSNLDQAKQDNALLQDRIRKVRADIHFFSYGDGAQVSCATAKTAGWLDAYIKNICQKKRLA